ncbi:MAG TPA: hypothetical protein VM580_16960, partial [Labilithrix sp.]|nr:hypothetical protein [Labilithrix sp.]
AEREIALRFVLDDAAAAEAVLTAVGTSLANGVGLRTHGIVTATGPGSGAVVDILASRDHGRGSMARRAPRLVLATERGVTSAGAVVPLPEGAVLGVIGPEPTGTLPEAARTVVREREARVLPLAIGDGGAMGFAAASAGAALAVASHTLKAALDAAAVAGVVAGSLPGPEAEAHGQRARGAFEATRDVLSVATRGESDWKPVGVA